MSVLPNGMKSALDLAIRACFQPNLSAAEIQKTGPDCGSSDRFEGALGPVLTALSRKRPIRSRESAVLTRNESFSGLLGECDSQ